MGYDNDPVYIDCDCIKETEKAILVNIDGEEKWIPKSQVVEQSDVQGEGDSGTLAITRWFAEKEGLA